MSSETEILKTNEFVRRRKLRLQQVREQSKDIAKKIRQRAKVEKLRQTGDLDSKKGREYLQQQEKLVRRLEQLYAQGVKSVGDSHKKATEERLNAISPEKNDLSKERGKEAVAELRRKKQERLDQQKKLLDRKLLARETANGISREKSSVVANKLLAKSSSSKLAEVTDQTNEKECPVADNTKVTRNDMATQWDLEELPNEWEPTVPSLSLPKDDKESLKDSYNAAESKSDKSKRLDLFALSAEMPSSLRGGNVNVPEDRSSIRPSVTLISEYLQSRALRLRETDTTGSSKKQSDDLQNIKQTILRSRSSKIEARGSVEKSTILSGVESNLSKKNSVTMYNHSTRNSRDIPRRDSGLVVRDLQTDEDAYSQALKESTNDNSKDEEHQKKLQEMRSKVAMTKQTVEKEYMDTMSFLKSLPKEKCTKQMKNAYMDERRQRILKVNRQQQLQQEFNKIEKECRKNCEKKHKTLNKSRNKSNSPDRVELDEDFESRDLQYSWMPVPESDGNLAIHTIPTTVKEGKTGNTVKFSKVDSYHEYRSRHKHTPPTKDTNHDKPRRVVETVIVQNDKDDSSDYSSLSSNTSSVENLNLDRKNNKTPEATMSEADKIIIYKILDKKEKERKKLKLIDNVAKVIKELNKEKHNKVVSDDNNNKDDKRHKNDVVDNKEIRPSVDQVDEGVYKVVSEKGENITSLYFSDNSSRQVKNIGLTEEELSHGRPCCCNKNSTTPQTDKGTNILCGNGEPSAAMRTVNCPGCKCGRSTSPRDREQANRTNLVVQPSAATSTSSFKTATTDKSHGAPDGGYIKLIDDDGQEAGKFYIGASGFLKDDAYELIIQLKKKEAAKYGKDQDKIFNYEKDVETEPIAQDLDSLNVNSAKSNQAIVSTENAESKEKEEIDVVNKEPHTALFQGSSSKSYGAKVQEGITQNENESTSSSEPISINKSSKQNKNLVDKGVHTSFQLSYAIPDNVPKTDPIPRPATSTYTQTTLDSPNLRPVFIHMSSSTSTAYMSPPEMVLPNFVRRDNDLRRKKLHYDLSEQCENDKCARKRCKCHKPKSSVPCNKHNKGYKILSTPPNTARGEDENSDSCDSENDWSLRKTHSKKCHKCSKNTDSSSNHQSKHHTEKRNVPSRKISSRKLVMHVTPSKASHFKNKVNNTPSNKRLCKSYLNPVIKDYVNRLLELNKEGIKAMEVANQECSSVSTPGSSIIEVPRNMNEKKSNVENKISLEQIKNKLKEKIIEEYVKESTNNNYVQTSYSTYRTKTNTNKLAKRKSVHKVKSLNISRRLLKSNKKSDKIYSNHNLKSNASTSSPSPARESVDKISEGTTSKAKSRSKRSPTPRQYRTFQPRLKNIPSDISVSTSTNKNGQSNRITSNSEGSSDKKNCQGQSFTKNINKFIDPSRKARTTSTESEFDILKRRQQDEAAMNISTQTSQDLDSEINLMKLAEDKLQNMEKIADLTEKCTKRLSNLAKVLEEVRKNKSLAYSQISTSDTASDSEHKSEKYTTGKKLLREPSDPLTNVQDKVKPLYDATLDMHDKSTTVSTDHEKEAKQSDSSEFVPFLKNIPKPTEFKLPAPQSIVETDNSKTDSLSSVNPDNVGKRREKPPPALSRIHLKHGQDVVPHELSTVIEVDSPMSVKMKNQSTTNTKYEGSDMSYRGNGTKDQKNINIQGTSTNNEQWPNPDLLQSNASLPKQPNLTSSTDSSEDSKMKMMDLKQFNELMLKPFISIQEFARQCGDVAALDDGSNLDDIPKVDGNDELSSLHSDGSLPDVIAELLKRNVISEPFKFDNLSNVNSNTVSSESTLSMLALSKVRKEKKKSSIVFQNKGNASETSDSLSISSNPDLENAFKKLGLGWASSTLKKTKERLALSSSSNTSSSSLSQFKLKGLSEQDIPALVTDSVFSTAKISSKKHSEKNLADNSKNVEQQTSFMNSMTVKEFLTNELAKKITFTNKSSRNDTADEFVSLLETKMPDEMKNLSQSVREERTIDSLPSAQNNRARTSTPVQIYKSMTYHSSSSSNMSNELFSNADDLSSVKVTSNSNRNHSTSDKDDLTIPNCSLKMRKGASDCSKSE